MSVLNGTVVEREVERSRGRERERERERWKETETDRQKQRQKQRQSEDVLRHRKAIRVRQQHPTEFPLFRKGLKRY